MALKDKYFTISEAAEEVGVTRQTISRWISRGKFPAEKIGREALIYKDDLRRYQSIIEAETLRKKIINRLISQVRKQFNYSIEDKIEEAKPIKKHLILAVNRKDGSYERLRVSVAKVDITEDSNNGGFITFNVDKIDKAGRKLKD